MKGEFLIEKQYVLTLSEQEAKILKEILQNPLHEEESIEEGNLRRSIFGFLTDC